MPDLTDRVTDIRNDDLIDLLIRKVQTNGFGFHAADIAVICAEMMRRMTEKVTA